MSLTPKTLTFFFPLFLHSVCFRACPFVCLFRLSLCTWPLWEAVESPAQERTRRVGICASPASCLTVLNLGFFFFFFGHRMRSCLRPEEAGWCDKKLAFLGSYGGLPFSSRWVRALTTSLNERALLPLDRFSWLWVLGNKVWVLFCLSQMTI